VAIIQIDNLPDDVYSSVQRLADQKNFTVNEAVIHLLKQALQSVEVKTLQEQQLRPIEGLSRIRNRSRINPIDFGLVDSTALIRDDRNC
jgi:hypothetical protein